MFPAEKSTSPPSTDAGAEANRTNESYKVPLIVLLFKICLVPNDEPKPVTLNVTTSPALKFILASLPVNTSIPTVFEPKFKGIESI